MSIEEPSARAGHDASQLRVSHADRDRMVEILRDAAVDGRLNTDELEERVERALTARTFADLEPLTEGLPVAAPAPPAIPAPGPAPEASGEVERLQLVARRFRREGPWVVPHSIELGMSGGTTLLDYTVAHLPEGGRSTIRITMHGGDVRLLLPPGVAVDLSGITTHGGQVRDKVSRTLAPGGVTHVITVTGSMVGGRFRALPSNPK